MDRDQEQLQFLGFFSTIKESFKIIFSWKKIFTQISLTLILPLSFIYLAHYEISQLFFFTILHHTSQRNETENPNRRNHLSKQISTEWATFWLFKLVYFTFLIILCLLSTAAVVYTIACIYTSKQITYKKVMSVVPRVWKRLLVTFLWTFSIFFVYNLAFAGVLVFWLYFLSESIAGLVVGIVLLILYIVGFVYLSVIWQLASVVSVMEDKYGRKAMKKSKSLIKGKMKLAVGIFVLFFIFFAGIEVLYEFFVVFTWPYYMAMSVPVGILCLFLLLFVILFGLVVETVIYFICKSYHHETIDKGALSDYLEVYLGDYVRLNKPDRDVQMEQQVAV